MNEEINTNWRIELEEHKAFLNHLGLYVCDCLDNKTSVKNIKKSLAALVDIEVKKLKRIRHEQN